MVLNEFKNVGLGVTPSLWPRGRGRDTNYYIGISLLRDITTQEVIWPTGDYSKHTQGHPSKIIQIIYFERPPSLMCRPLKLSAQGEWKLP